MTSEQFVPLTCTPKGLGNARIVEAHENAVRENPANAAPVEKLLRFVPDLDLTPQKIGVLTTKYLGPRGARKIPVYFLEGGKATQTKILKYANKWGKGTGIKFLRTSDRGTSFVRVALEEGQGYWSYLGLDCLLVPKNQQTMNLDSFTTGTPDSEYDRVVCHEFGHALGFPHEHMRQDLVNRLDPEKVIAEFMRSQGWSRSEVVAQVLTPISERALLNPTPADEDSIMCYQLPGELTRDGRPILGGTKIDRYDYSYAAKIYPAA